MRCSFRLKRRDRTAGKTKQTPTDRVPLNLLSRCVRRTSAPLLRSLYFSDSALRNAMTCRKRRASTPLPLFFPPLPPVPRPPEAQLVNRQGRQLLGAPGVQGPPQDKKNKVAYTCAKIRIGGLNAHIHLAALRILFALTAL